MWLSHDTDYVTAEPTTTQLPPAQGRPMQQVQPVSPHISPQSPPVQAMDDLAGDWLVL